MSTRTREPRKIERFDRYRGHKQRNRRVGAILVASTLAVAAVRDLGIEIRAGVHTGEVETIDGKVGGLAVIIGARVGTKAGPSQIFVSQTVKALVAGSRLVFEDTGEHELKGVPDRWRLYRVVG